MWLSWLPLTTAKAKGSAVVKLFNLSLSHLDLQGAVA